MHYPVLPNLPGAGCPGRPAALPAATLRLPSPGSSPGPRTPAKGSSRCGLCPPLRNRSVGIPGAYGAQQGGAAPRVNGTAPSPIWPRSLETPGKPAATTAPTAWPGLEGASAFRGTPPVRAVGAAEQPPPPAAGAGAGCAAASRPREPRNRRQTAPKPRGNSPETAPKPRGNSPERPRRRTDRVATRRLRRIPQPPLSLPLPAAPQPGSDRLCSRGDTAVERWVGCAGHSGSIQQPCSRVSPSTRMPGPPGCPPTLRRECSERRDAHPPPPLRRDALNARIPTHRSAGRGLRVPRCSSHQLRFPPGTAAVPQAGRDAKSPQHGSPSRSATSAAGRGRRGGGGGAAAQRSGRPGCHSAHRDTAPPRERHSAVSWAPGDAVPMGTYHRVPLGGETGRLTCPPAVPARAAAARLPPRVAVVAPRRPSERRSRTVGAARRGRAGAGLSRECAVCPSAVCPSAVCPSAVCGRRAGL
ncbi:basic salivary proline-rich protein 1-like [Myiozetetes cayanensis]|uniref:basic salivary proline-rich protein 1-like n=1 Tax=Myiozetetes cayanensis TaxID=478635 RepID=UPI00215FAC5B|nr:basic salivary proline-rich protein 1-like [Myiozetetes cayanensis]